MNILITGANKNSIKIPFERSFKVGDLYTILIKDVPFREFSYQLYADDKIVEDPYAQYVYGNEDWGVFHKGKRAQVTRSLRSFVAGENCYKRQ